MKKTQLEKAIASIDADIQVLEFAKQRLMQEHPAKTQPRITRRPRVVPAKDEKASA